MYERGALAPVLRLAASMIILSENSQLRHAATMSSAFIVFLTTPHTDWMLSSSLSSFSRDAR